MATHPIAQLPLNLQGADLDGLPVCMQCGKRLTFKVERDKQRKKFCSLPCRGKYYGRKKRPFVVHDERKCVKCGSIFTATMRRHIYCSKNCQQIGATQRYELRMETLDFHLQKLRLKKGGRWHNRNAITQSLLYELWERQNGRCAISGEPMTWLKNTGYKLTNASLDRIDSSRGYLPDNVQLVCFIVNIMKRDMAVSELVKWATKITEHAHGTNGQ